MSVEDRIAVAQAYVDALNNTDIEAVKAIYADDATVEDPVGSELTRGIDAIAEFYQRGFGMSLHLELTGAVRAAGNTIAFPFVINMEIEGQKSRIDVIDVFEFNDEGKVCSMKAYWGPENTHAV